MIKRIIDRLLFKYYRYTGNLVKGYRTKGMKIGKNCCIYSGEFWDEAYLITIGNHVQITAGVKLFTHGGGWMMRDQIPNYDSFGKICIGSNVYIGNNAIILPGIAVGNNVIIAAGSVVTKNIPDDVIVAGNPARIVGDTIAWINKNKCYNLNTKNLTNYEKKQYLISLPDDKFIKCDAMLSKKNN